MTPYILIIEDDPVLGKLSLEAARQLGLKAVLDENGDQYAALIQEHGIPSLVLLDLHLPFAAGADILQHLRADARLSGVPFLITTADIIQSRNLQAQGEKVLLKPVSMLRMQDIFTEYMAG